MTQTIWIARHGNRLDFVTPEWFNTAERRYDPPLSEDGMIQAQQLANRLKSEPIRHIFVSPFLRAIQTANPIAEKLNLPLKLEAGLSEWFNPDWMSETPQTHPKNFLANQYPRIDWTYQSRIIPRYPESEIQVYQRTAATIKQLIPEYNEDILLVGHSISVVGTTRELVGGNPSITATLCCLVKVVREKDQWKLKLKGDTAHLNTLSQRD